MKHVPPLRRLSTGILIVWVALVVVPRMVRAGDSVEEHLKRGVHLLSQEKNEEALEEFRAAYAIRPSPKAAVEAGLAESALRLWADAESHLLEGLRASADDWIRPHRALIEDQLEKVRTHLGWLIVTGTESTDVFVDGALVGKLPLPARIRRAEGPVTVQGRLLGYQTMVKNVEVLGKSNRAVSLEFAVAPPPPPAQSVAAPAVALPPPAPSPARAPSGPFFYQSLPWLSTAAGALALGDLALILKSNYSCTGGSPCTPSKALEVGVGVAGISGFIMGGSALIMGATHRSDPHLVKPVLLVTSALAAVGAIAGGITLVRDNQHNGADGKWAYGAGTIGAGGIVLLLEVAALFEPTPSRPRPVRIALVPAPGGVSLLGTF